MFKAFLHEKDVAKTLKPLVTMKGAMNNMKRRLNLFRSKMVVKEKDPWFQVNILQINLYFAPELIGFFTSRLVKFN